MFEHYLTDRKQRVVLNGIESPWENLLSGVPQCSVLGPLFFLIYINDLALNISASIKLFADDASLFIQVRNVDAVQATLMNDLKLITEWAHIWKMKFNPEVSKQVVSRRYQEMNLRSKSWYLGLRFFDLKVSWTKCGRFPGQMRNDNEP